MINRQIQAVGLDIGTSKVRCVIGEPSENGVMNVVGIGESESRGLRRGIVSTTDAVAESIKRAVEDAEQVSGLEVQMATVNLSGEHLQGENKGGVVAVAGAGREITEDDVERAIESASAMPLPAGWEIIDRLPQEFIIDGQDGITEPVGMRGARLESRVHVIISPSAGKQNIEKAVNRAGLEVEGMVLEPLAAATSTLTDDDKEYGCALINIGAELTSLTIFGRGAVQHTRVFPFGGMHFTKDIALGLRVSIPEANAIKRDYGCVAPFLFRDGEAQEVIEINPVGRSETRGLSKEILCDILAPRAIELLQHLAHEVNRTGAQNSSGVVLTGGGSQVRGMVEIAEQVFDAPTRLGFVNRELFGGLVAEVQKPEWATACGLALISMRRQIREQMLGPTTATQKVAAWFESFRGKFK
ncbi:MAG: cell division protein FtsA [Acidobacteria bacterium]|nr:cell division protein FtsA [Acidobacteriota bacterium]MBK8147881.1 cell division protein FtsA [Acidobacteriota bacterium]MBK8812168.1 cell division protein FtsA [Acidobacteriota bacterium]